MSNYEAVQYAQLMCWAANFRPEWVEPLQEAEETHRRSLRIVPLHSSQARFWAQVRAWWYREPQPNRTTAILLMWRCSCCKAAIASPGQCVLRAKQVLESHLRPVQQVEYAMATLRQHTPPTLVPKVPRDLARIRAMTLAEKLRQEPNLPPIRHAGCWNCGLGHNMTECPFPREASVLTVGIRGSTSRSARDVSRPFLDCRLETLTPVKDDINPCRRAWVADTSTNEMVRRLP
ncbi:uncharacterized protein LOC141528100 [Cotesia typhae]|uniref:uncharacterized protein LOC141528100 n=1 Tax=Cotesia typhae TaxID=2053667 RepID=UPI003D69A059